MHRNQLNVLTNCHRI